MKFSLSDKQAAEFLIWSAEQNAQALEKSSPTGAIGGNLTFSFTPTTLGVVVKVNNSLTDSTIDLTDYDGW